MTSTEKSSAGKPDHNDGDAGRVAGGCVFTERAAAKVNLTLCILGRRDDGYHELASLVAFADIGDVVTLDLSSGLVDVAVHGPMAGQIVGDNIVSRALTLLREADSSLRLGTVSIEKHLPVAAGLGGGSANAAALLRAVRRANIESAPRIDWYGIARQLGADVPVCLENRACWMEGTGERLTTVDGLQPLEAVLVNPGADVPADKTAQVFRTLAAPRFCGAGECASPPSPEIIGDRSALIEFMRASGNNLRDAACKVVPEIADVLEALSAMPGCEYTGMSGAGPTCFGVFEDAPGAAAQISAQFPDYWVAPVVIS